MAVADGHREAADLLGGGGGQFGRGVPRVGSGRGVKPPPATTTTVPLAVLIEPV